MIANIMITKRVKAGVCSTTTFNDIPVIQLTVEGKVHAMMRYNPVDAEEVILQKAQSLAQAAGLFSDDVLVVIPKE